MRNSRLAGGLAALAVFLVLLVSAPAVLAATPTPTTSPAVLAATPTPIPAPNPGTVAIAQRYLGVPYLAGGASAKGVSVPGFTKLVYRRARLWLSWSVAGQARHGVAITRDALKPGDLVFSSARHHVGLYVGGGSVITMPGPGSVVSYAGMDDWGADLAFRRYDANTGYHAALIAKRYLGVPYVWGGASPSGFDASGLTMYVYAQLGARLVHGATDQQKASTPVPINKLRRGDLVFFGNAEYSHHVGIYMGKGRMIDAPHTGAVVSFNRITDAWIGGRVLPIR